MPDSQEKFYDRYWTESDGEYSGDRTGYAENFRRWMAKNLAGFQGSDEILEVGCGDASFTKDLARFSDRVSAIDVSPKQVAANRARYPQIQFLAHDLSEPLPFDDDRFHAIWCSEVLEHLFDPAFAVREMHRVLKPGGLLMLTVPFHGLFKNLMIALFKWDHHFDPEYPHVRFFTENTLRRLCTQAGFTKIVAATCGMNRPLRDLLIPTNLLLRAHKPA